MAIFKIEFIKRNFGTNETIEAVIRSENKNETISGGLLTLLVNEFNKKNGKIVPIVGTTYFIPIIRR